MTVAELSLPQEWEEITPDWMTAALARDHPGAVVDTVLDGDARLVAFADGRVVREVFVDLDETRRRFVYSIRDVRLDHHNGSNQVFDEGAGRCRFVWIVDVLPAAVAGRIEEMMTHSADILKTTLEQASKAA